MNEEKVWFILLEGKQKGPYSLSQLQKSKKISFTTLVWREGWEKWIPLKMVPKLKKLLLQKNKKTFPPSQAKDKKVEKPKPGEDALTLEWRGKNPAFFLLILTLILILAFYLFWSWRKY